MDDVLKPAFYEDFWADSDYQLGYAFDSAVRDRFPAVQTVWGDLKRPRRVLDFGSGNGVLTYWMHCNGFGDEILGIDVSDTGVGFGNRAFGRDGLRYQRVEPDAPLDHLGHFDALVSSHVVEHLDDPVKALRSMRGLAEWYVLEVPLEDCVVPNALAKIRGRDRKDNPVGHVQFWTRKAFGEVLEEAGFLVVRDYQYASAPFSPYTSTTKRILERALLSATGVRLYSRLMATHYAVLARVK
ncbi:class I SAM-dependent methyltransferase [Caenispirillum salinarum]|uniref:class I SAM-dependent methyltransferase n=1 Tax=Caenispirillum salinarum TaxID=859058 RepID=UPI00385131F4